MTKLDQNLELRINSAFNTFNQVNSNLQKNNDLIVKRVTLDLLSKYREEDIAGIFLRFDNLCNRHFEDLPSFVLSIVTKIVQDIELKQEERATKYTMYSILKLLETASIGINAGILDVEMLRPQYGRYFVKSWEAIKESIYILREEYSDDLLYFYLERLVDEWMYHERSESLKE